MATLIVTVLFGLFIAYFATQNPGSLSLSLMHYRLPDLPIYIIITVAFLLGLLLSWIISLVNEFTMGLKLRGKDHAIKDFKKENISLEEKIKQLEIENARLRGEISTLNKN